MKKWLTRIIICLTLGAITTVAVAWGIALRVPHASNVTETQWNSENHLELLPPRVRPDVPASFLARESTIETIWANRIEAVNASNRVVALGISTHRQFARSGRHPYRVVVWHQTGWPTRCLESVGCFGINRHAAWDGSVQGQSSWPVGILRPDWLPTFLSPRQNRMIRSDFAYTPALPTRPLWPEFAINELLFASVWFALVPVPGIVRYQIRQARGRCPKCAYILEAGVEAGCPECGWNRGRPAAETGEQE